MKTFQVWPLLPLGSTVLSEPYQTASARPGPPALIHGKTLTASPVAVEAPLTWRGPVHLAQPLAEDAALTNTWRSDGVSDETHQTTKRFRAESIEATLN